MAMALPTVAYDTAVNREYLGDLGVYAPPSDVDAFTAAIDELVHNAPLRVALGRRLRERVMEHFSWPVAAKRILNIYQNIDKRAE